MPPERYGQARRSQLIPVSEATFAGLAIVWAPPRPNSATSRTPVQAVQLKQLTPGLKFWPMQETLVSRKAKVSPTASPVPLSEAAPPELVSIPWPHSWRKTAAISPVFEQPPRSEERRVGKECRSR